MEGYFQFYTWPNSIFTGAGALFLWCKLGRKELTVYGLGYLWEVFLGQSKIRDVLEVISFVGFGILIGIGFAHPTSVIQAVSAGLGWTGLLAHAKNPPKAVQAKKTRNRKKTPKAS